MKAGAFQNQVVIITGASSGIGKSLALLLADQGAKMAIAARRANRLEQVATECRSRGSRMLAIPTDVSDETQCKQLIEKTVAEYGRLDMLINNAGLAASAMFDEFPDLSSVPPYSGRQPARICLLHLLRNAISEANPWADRHDFQLGR